MPDVEHNEADRDTNGGRGVHPQLGRSDVADDAARVAQSQIASDKGRFVWQDSDGTIWAQDGAGGSKLVAGRRPMYDATLPPLAQYDLDGNANDSGPNGLHLPNSFGSAIYEPFPLDGGESDCYNTTPGSSSEDGDATATFDPLRVVTALSGQAWIKPSGLTSVDVLFTQGAGSGGSVNNLLYQLTTSGTAVVYAHQYGVNVTETVTIPAGIMSLHRWQHLAFVRNAAGTVVKLYYNGSRMITSGTLTAPALGSAGVFSLGNAPAHGFPFVGHMKGVRLDAAELTDAQIADSYYRGLRQI